MTGSKKSVQRHGTLAVAHWPHRSQVHGPLQPVYGKMRSIELLASEPWNTASRIKWAVLLNSEEQAPGGSAHEDSAEAWVRRY